MMPDKTSAPLIDPFGRTIDYVRISVTDRCDFRCVYCMSELMTFLPKTDLLSLEELERLGKALIRRGVKRIRLTGGEPLVRRNVMQLVEALGTEVKAGRLQELTLTTNGSQLARFAEPLAAAGVKRINVSVDTLDPDRFAAITRWGKLPQVLDGITAAKAAGLKIKINAVALKDVNEDEFDAMIAWCGLQGFDLTLIETMPLGEIEDARANQYLPLSLVRERLAQRWSLLDTPYQTGGPARYVQVAETGQKLGFITPLSHNFCESCNRVRITCTGEMFMCLGQEDKADLRSALRASENNEAFDAALVEAISRKPKGHDFIIDRSISRPAVLRHMSVTGG
jgi:GTP 3',8-cyclase